MERSADGRIRTTEWEDVQYKFGNRVGKYATHELHILAQQLSDRCVDAALRTYNPDEEKARDRHARSSSFSNDSGDDAHDDDDDDDDDAELRALRRKRLGALKQRQQQLAASCGVLRHIAGSSYVDEVTDASVRQWVVAVLVQPAMDACDALLHVLRLVAQRQRDVKFVSITASEAVAQLPTRYLPCVLLYRDKKLVQQLTGLDAWRDERGQLSVRVAECTLQHYGVLAQQSDRNDDKGDVSSRSDDDDDDVAQGDERAKRHMSVDGALLVDVARLQRERAAAHCLVVTGPRGSGKSFVLRAFVDGMARQQRGRVVVDDDVMACLQSGTTDDNDDVNATTAVAASSSLCHTCADSLVCVLDYTSLCRLQQQRLSSSSSSLRWRAATVVVIDDVDVLWRLCRMQASVTTTTTTSSSSGGDDGVSTHSLTSLLRHCLTQLLHTPRCALVTSARREDALPRFLRTLHSRKHCDEQSPQLLPPLHYALPERPLGAAAAERLLRALPPDSALHARMTQRASDAHASQLAAAASLTSSRQTLVMALCVAAHTRDAAATVRTTRWLASTNGDNDDGDNDGDGGVEWRMQDDDKRDGGDGRSRHAGAATLTTTTLYGLDDVEARLRKLVFLFAAYHSQDDADDCSSDSSSGGALLASLRGTTGILLHGPSGCGKTTLTRRLAAAFPRVRVVFVPCTRLFSKYLGESEERLRRVYRHARAKAPAVVVLDNMDVIAQSRGAAVNGGGGGDSGGGSSGRVDVHRRMLACLLCELDGVGDNSRVLTIGTTSAPHVLDAALLRQGRLETMLSVPALSRDAACAMARHTFAALLTTDARSTDANHNDEDNNDDEDGAATRQTGVCAGDAQARVDALAAYVAARAVHCTPVALRYVLRKIVEHTLHDDDDNDNNDKDATTRPCACRRGDVPAAACVAALLDEHAEVLQPVQ